MSEMKVWVVNQYFYTPSDGTSCNLKTFKDYDKARAYVENFQKWFGGFCDTENDVWGTEYFEIHIEESEVE